MLIVRSVYRLSGDSQVTFPDTVYAHRDTQTRLASDTADNLLWERYSTGAAPEVAAALRRMTFAHEMASRPLHAALEAATKAFAAHKTARPMIVVGRSRRLAVEAHSAELRALLTEKNSAMGSDLVKAMGDLGTAVVASHSSASLLVLQAAPGS